MSVSKESGPKSPNTALQVALLPTCPRTGNRHEGQVFVLLP